ncbi:hypothetical protein HMPREF3038_00482 [Akkermansia sp. KLE1797]|nr:hypothetical protein HMPREF3038_00482 [Akkermansia sp. KLE1797]KXU55600.1 hypothetical protein HMPREF3039_00157 [Akkermansia sp. KLE1798]KZA05469.1 hypothetical protein HMPREF1326_00876 [Akkermansia sp. KLE1605]
MKRCKSRHSPKKKVAPAVKRPGRPNYPMKLGPCELRELF